MNSNLQKAQDNPFQDLIQLFNCNAKTMTYLGLLRILLITLYQQTLFYINRLQLKRYQVLQLKPKSTNPLRNNLWYTIIPPRDPPVCSNLHPAGEVNASLLPQNIHFHSIISVTGILYSDLYQLYWSIVVPYKSSDVYLFIAFVRSVNLDLCKIKKSVCSQLVHGGGD